MTTTLPVVGQLTPAYLSFYRILPLSLEGGTLSIAVVGTPSPEVIIDLEASYGGVAQLIPVEDSELEQAIQRAFAAADSVGGVVRDLSATVAESATGEDLGDLRDLANQAPVIRFVNVLIREAADAGASDIHLEAVEGGLRVRLRIDGVLSELPSPPVRLRAAIVSRLKLMADLDIAERRIPQDGRIRARLESRELDLRISTVPTLVGESVVLRLLDRGGTSPELDSLGIGSETLTQFQRLAERSHGIVLATGPTGSGKTTTLYAALRLRRPTEEKIITVEDPVEYHLPGVTQVPVHRKAGVTFGSALRSLLRQDPDVLMVGEMRDQETASIAIQAALTGHMVFSTLHTTDAPGALTRLADLGLEPYLIAATVEGILAQRLVRRVCGECRAGYAPDPSILALLVKRPMGSTKNDAFAKGIGCARCRGTGFRGRTGIFELLHMTDDLQTLVLKSGSPSAIRELARHQGMTTLLEDGLTKARAGITTVEEVLRVVDA